MFLADAGKVKETSTSDNSAISDSEGTPLQPETNAVDADAELLAQIPFFSGLDRSRLKLLAFTSDRQTLEAQENLIVQGDRGDMAYVVVDGTFSIVVETTQGRVKVSDAGRGGVIGELALLCEAPRTATVQASKRSTVLKIDKEVFIRLIKDNPGVGANLSRILASKLEAMMRSMSAHYELYDPVSTLPNRSLFLDNLKTTAYLDKRNDQISSFVLINFDGLEELELLQSELETQTNRHACNRRENQTNGEGR